ncbi:MAG: class B sortase [Oscillospiraceae bacterium]|nr:class B sortase [Oscillospiraceae bacterium]
MSKKTSNKKKYNSKMQNKNISKSTSQKQSVNRAQTSSKNKSVNRTQSASKKKTQTNYINKFLKLFKSDSIGLTAFTAIISIICIAVIAIFLVTAMTSADITVDETPSSSDVSSSSVEIEQEEANITTKNETVLRFNRDSVIYTAELKLEDAVSDRHTEFLTTGKTNSSSSQSSENTQTDTSSSSEQEASSSKPSSSYSTSVSISTTNFQSNLSQYKAINSDTVAWINVPGTNINYPVVKYATDNNYYIDKDVYKNYSRNGVIWADFRNSFPTLSKNTIFYGHNWTNISYSPRIGSSSDVMFAQLTSLQYTSQVAKYPYINVSVEGRDMKFVIFANFYTNVSFYYIDPNPSSLMTLVNGARERSESIINVDVNESDKILTLSTCTRAFGKSDKQRFVVMARLLRDGESLSNISVSKNPNPRSPF